MTPQDAPFEPERYELDEAPRYRFDLTRRAFVQVVGVGLLITTTGGVSFAQRRSTSRETAGGRFDLNEDGTITAYCGKVDVGQDSRTQLTMAVCEELGVPLNRVSMVLADTALSPNDGGTYGSLTTPRTVPTMRRAAVAAREALLQLAADHWDMDASDIALADGVLTGGGKTMTLAELVKHATNANTVLDETEIDGADLTETRAWKRLGTNTPMTTGRDVATGQKQYPSDIRREGMLYGKVLRPPSYGATLTSLDESAVAGMEGVTLVRDGDFVGVTAPTTFHATKALEALAKTAQWETAPHPSSTELFEVLKNTATEGSGRRRSRTQEQGDVTKALVDGAKTVSGRFEIPYIQHAPMETRAAVAEWNGDGLTVWTGTQRPFGVQRELCDAFHLPESKVRNIVPDTGGGFGGKHTGECAIEAARLAKGAGKPVSLHWTRDEEFMWAYFRPAGLIETAVALDADGAVTAWDFKNYNSGGSGLECPYDFPNVRTQFKYCDSPLREGSYRALAGTANNFARETFIDHVAREAGEEPLAFRLKYLSDARLKAVLQRAVEAHGASFGQGTTHGMACGALKGSYIATCAEVALRDDGKGYTIVRLTNAFDCGAVQNPRNLEAQVDGSVVQGLGAVLSEAMTFENGAITNGSFRDYHVPRFEDVPPMKTVLMDDPDVESAGAGETPMICVAPAIANALYAATGTMLTALPLRLA